MAKREQSKLERPELGRRGFLKGVAGAGAALIAAPALLSSGALAQGGWPARPVRFIVPLAAGGGLDFIARLVAESVTRSIGQQVVVENRTGAGGTIGIEAVVSAAPDGYTVLISNDNVASAPHVQQLGRDYTQSLIPVSQLTRQPQSISVHPSLGVKSMEDLIKHAKEKPGEGAATSGIGSNQHVLLALFQQAAGVEFTHVPYRGAGQAIADLVGGQIKIGFLGPAAVMPHAQSGALTILAQSSSKRSSSLPDTPTLTELGIDVVVESWFGAFLPVGTPDELVTRINAEFDKAMKDPQVLERLGRAATDPVGGPPDVMAKQYKEEADKYARIVKELGITAK